MKNFRNIYFLVIILSFNVTGQETSINDSIPHIYLTTISQISQGNSYITFPTDIGIIEPLVFEGNLVPNFYIRKSKDSRLIGVLTPQIIIRMYQEVSVPVRTPSYMPQVTAYYLISTKTNVNTLSSFARYAHHSNGQEGDFYLENGEINLKTGNFATNYLELGLIKTTYNKKYNAAQYFATSFQYHPKAFTADELEGIYSLYRWNSTFSIFKLPEDDNIKNKKPSISVKGKTTWMFGDYNSLNSFSLERLNLTFTFFYQPKFLDEIGFFAQIYHGQDYYNIYFDRQISVLRFGIMTEKLRF